MLQLFPGRVRCHGQASLNDGRLSRTRNKKSSNSSGKVKTIIGILYEVDLKDNNQK